MTHRRTTDRAIRLTQGLARRLAVVAAGSVLAAAASGAAAGVIPVRGGAMVQPQAATAAGTGLVRTGNARPASALPDQAGRPRNTQANPMPGL